MRYYLIVVGLLLVMTLEYGPQLLQMITVSTSSGGTVGKGGKGDGGGEEEFRDYSAPDIKADVAIGNLQMDYFDKWGPSINFKKSTRDFGNFGTIGTFPTMPICDKCHLDTNCPNFTFNGQQNVCHVCRRGRANYSNLDEPLYVGARSVGRPRQCRLLLN